MQDRERIIRKHLLIDMNIEALVFEPLSGVAKCIVVSFSAMNRESSFDRWSWFLRRNESHDDAVYIVFKDDSKKYYFGDDGDPMSVRYRRFIERYLAKYGLGMSNVISVGSSMGGYAALYYAFLCGFFGACVTNPQVDFRSARRHEQYNWERHIRSVGPKWEDISDFLFRVKGRPKVFIGHGTYPADFSAAERLVTAMNERRISYIREYDFSEDHSSYGLSEARLFRLLDYWRSEMHGDPPHC